MKLALSTLLLMSLMQQSACSGAYWLDPPDRYADRGVIVVHTNFSAAQTAPYLASFRALYPAVEVRLYHLSSRELFMQLSESRQREEEPAADVLWGVPLTQLLQLAHADALAPVPAEAAKLISDPRFIDEHDPPLWAGTSAMTTALCMNRDKLIAAGVLPVPSLTRWDLIFNDGRLRGLLAMPSPQKSPVGFMLLGTFLLQRPSEPESVWQAIAALKDKLHDGTTTGSFVDDEDRACELAAAPSGPVAIGISSDAAARFVKKGSGALEVSVPQESGYEIWAHALTRKWRVSGTARLFLSWALSQPAIDAYRTYYVTTAYPAESGAGANLEQETRARWLREYSLEYLAGNHELLLETWGQRIGTE